MAGLVTKTARSHDVRRSIASSIALGHKVLSCTLKEFRFRDLDAMFIFILSWITQPLQTSQ